MAITKQWLKKKSQFFKREAARNPINAATALEQAMACEIVLDIHEKEEAELKTLIKSLKL